MQSVIRAVSFGDTIGKHEQRHTASCWERVRENGREGA
jgi:hypothetical protein